MAVASSLDAEDEEVTVIEVVMVGGKDVEGGIGGRTEPLLASDGLRPVVPS